MTKATIKDVAELAGVSISSVSRFMADPTSVNNVYAMRIDDAITKLNYIPSTSARSLRKGSSNIVGFVQPDISQDLFNQCVKCLTEMLYQNNYMLISCETSNNPEKERRVINSLLQQNVAAIVVISCGTNTSFLQELATKTDKLIIANRPEPLVNADSIYEDQINSGYRLGCYMLDKGYKKCAVLYGVPYSAASANRVGGLKKAFETYGIELTDGQTIGNCIDYTSSCNAVQQLLTDYPDTECVFVTNQRAVQGAIFGLQSMGKTIGKDIVLAGFTSKKGLVQSNVKFPCIMEDTEKLGLLLSDFVTKKIVKTSKQSHVEFEVPLVDLDNNVGSLDAQIITRNK